MHLCSRSMPIGIAIILGLTACSGSDSSSPTPLPPTTFFELHNPAPTENGFFGIQTLILPNGNIVITAPFDSSIAEEGGAVHLYDLASKEIIASFYGDIAYDRLGDGVTALPNSNFVISSPSDTEGGIENAGSVRLIDGATGQQIGPTLAGDVEYDTFGYTGVTALANNNFVFTSKRSEGGIDYAGSVRLIDSLTGVQIGPTLSGDVNGNGLESDGDLLGSDGVTRLANNNYVVASSYDDQGSFEDAGSVRLMDGATGEQIGPTLAGGNHNDRLGLGSVTALLNNNFVVVSPSDTGSVRLMNGATGTQIGTTLTGDEVNDFGGGSESVTALANSNFVVVSPSDDVGGIENAGSVRLIDGNTGEQIGPTLEGDEAQDRLGSNGTTALANSNFVVLSPLDNVNGIEAAGSIRLMNGATGEQIGPTLEGDEAADLLGKNGATALANNNFVVASSSDDVGGIEDAGSVRLMDGTTGEQIGATVAGDMRSDTLGKGGVAALANSNFVVVSPYDNENDIPNAGSVRLMDGTTGEQIGTTVAGDMRNDTLGGGGVAALVNNNIVVVSPDAGSVRLLSGVTGTEITPPFVGLRNIGGEATFTVSTHVDYFILSLVDAYNNGLRNSGRVLLIEP